MQKIKQQNLIMLTVLPLHEKKGPSYARIQEYIRGLSTCNNLAIYLAPLQNFGVQINEERYASSYSIGKQPVNIKYRKSYLENILGFNSRRKQSVKVLNVVKLLKGNTVFFIYPPIGTFLEEYYYINKIRGNRYKIFSERNELKAGIVMNMLPPIGIIKCIVFYALQPFALIEAYLKDLLVYFYDGNIVISANFQRWISKKKNNYLRIPILYHSLINNTQYNKKSDVFKIGYTGSLSFKKDGIDILLKAIALIKNKYAYKIKIMIAGYGNDSQIKRFLKLIDRLNITSCVEYLGNVKHEKSIKLQTEMDLLVMVRRSNIQNNFGFSTKLGEYMASGTPILVTKVSDNDLYVHDSENGFFINSTDSRSVAKKIIEIIKTDKKQIDSITTDAKKTVEKYFNIDHYKRKLFRFFFNENCFHNR